MMKNKCKHSFRVFKALSFSVYCTKCLKTWAFIEEAREEVTKDEK